VAPQAFMALDHVAASAALTASTRSHGRGVAKGLSARVSYDEPSALLVSILNTAAKPRLTSVA
jgi:hypothetical protein